MWESGDPTVVVQFPQARHLPSRAEWRNYRPMPAKHSPAIRVAAALGLGLTLTACGPIAFQDTVKFNLPEPKVEAPPVVAEAAPPARARLSGDTIVIDDKIQFEYNSAEIMAVSHSLLDEVVKVMQDNPQIEELDIVGHTSSEGSLKHNNKLSADRAASVKKYMTDKGVDAKRLVSQGKGPSEPIADNATDEGKEANRRVEFKVIKSSGPAAAAEVSSGSRARPGN